MPKNDNLIHATFVKALRQASKEQGISMQKISRDAGYNKGTVSKMVYGETLGNLNTWNDLFNTVGIEIGFRIVQKD